MIESSSEADAEMSPYVRSLYCSGVMEGLEPLLDPNNTNEMGLVNALQVLSFLKFCFFEILKKISKLQIDSQKRIFTSFG